MGNNPVQSREKHDYFSNFPAETNHGCHFNCSADFCSISKTVTKDTESQMPMMSKTSAVHVKSAI